MKFGHNNGEVYAEVATTRLLWALGFGADRMYPVASNATAVRRSSRARPARAARRCWSSRPPSSARCRVMPSRRKKIRDGLARAGPGRRSEPVARRRAQIDGLRLLASLLQHTDSKPAQQRLLCLPTRRSQDDPAECAEPMMMLNDVGLTFGHANTFNRNGPGSVNFEEWSKTPVWKDTRVASATSPSR